MIHYVQLLVHSLVVVECYCVIGILVLVVAIITVYFSSGWVVKYVIFQDINSPVSCTYNIYIYIYILFTNM